MNLNDAKQKVKKVRNILTSENVEVNLYILWKKDKNMLFSQAEIDGSIKQSFIDRVLNDYKENSEMMHYSVLLEKTDSVLYGQTGEYPYSEKYIETLKTADKNDSIIEDLSTVRNNLFKIKGYCAEVCSNGEHIYVFGSTSTFNSLTKKKFGFVGNMGSNKITKLSEDDALIGFNSVTTCFIYDNTCIIKRKKAFEDLFGLLELFKMQGQTTIEEIQKYPDFFQGIDNLKEDLDKRPVLYRSLSNMSKRLERVKKITEHRKDIEKILSSPEFEKKYDKITINETGLVYSYEGLGQFLSLLNEKPVQSLITGDKFLADRDE